MFRQVGIHILRLTSGAADTGQIQTAGNAAGMIIVPLGFTGLGSASVYAGSEKFGYWPLFDGDGVTPITINLQPNMAILIPADAMITPSLKIVFATAITRDEKLYFAQKS